MPEPPTTDNLTGLLICTGDQLIFDADDPSTYIVCHAAEDIEAAVAALQTKPDC